MQSAELLEQTSTESAQPADAPKPKNAPKKKATKKSKNPLAESLAKRRDEIWGVFIMLLSALFLVALFFYDIEDEALIENIALWEVFSDVARRAAQELHNPLGLFGAKLSSFLMRSMLGYPTALLLAISAFWGYALFRRQGFSKAIYLTVYGALFAALLASMFGLTELSFSESMSGAMGRFIATTLSTLIGEFGAWCILSVLMSLVVALFIDLDLQKTFDRIAYLTRDKASELANGAALKFKEWREARERALQEELAEEAEEEPVAEPAPQPVAAPESPIERNKEERSASANDAPSPRRAAIAPVAPEPAPQRAVEPFNLREFLNDVPATAPVAPEPPPAPIIVETQSLEASAQPAPIEPQTLPAPSPVSDSIPEPAPPAEPASIEPPQARALSPFEEAIDRELEKLLNGFEQGAKTSDAIAPEPLIAPEPVATPKIAEKDEALEALLAEIAASKAKAASEEPAITLKEGAREKEADLDERQLEVETKAHFTYQFPSVDLLIDPDPETDAVSMEELETNKRKLLDKLRIYKIEVVRVEATVGPRVTLFELELAPDVKVSRITSLADDLAMAMAARGIRIIAPIPGKNAVGVEIPNSKSRIVRIKTLLQSEKFKNFKGVLPIAFGKTISNEIYIDDLARMPHLLVAGATGSGKSVGINAILTSLIYFCSPEKVKFLLIDPKRVELFPYQKLKRHFLVKFKDLEEQIITDTSKAVYALKSIEKEMDLRYDRLAKAGVRNIKDFNAKFPDDALPYVVVVIDELADMMITAGRDVEEPIARLAQLARAVGIHLVVATQRPSVDVITGVIKANFPARVAYQVASKIDSRTILDAMGAEQLLGHGDMLYLPATEPKPIRIQNAFVSTEEVEAIAEFIAAQQGYDLSLELPAPDLKVSNAKGEMDGEDEGDFERDKMFEEAARLVVRHQQGSVSLLQRRLKLGFGRAARIMDQLEQAGIVGKPDGSKPREVLVESEESLELLLKNLD